VWSNSKPATVLLPAASLVTRTESLQELVSVPAMPWLATVHETVSGWPLLPACGALTDETTRSAHGSGET
jgi:hypothetical protein